MARYTSVRDRDLKAPVVDYSSDYPNNQGKPLGQVSYEELKSGTIEVAGKRIRTAGLSSYYKARNIAAELKKWVERGDFLLGRPVDALPGAESGRTFRGLEERPVNRPANGRQRR